MTTFLIASGIAFWVLIAFTVGLCIVAVAQAARTAWKTVRLDPISVEVEQGIGAIEQHLAGDD